MQKFSTERLTCPRYVDRFFSAPQAGYDRPGDTAPTPSLTAQLALAGECLSFGSLKTEEKMNASAGSEHDFGRATLSVNSGNRYSHRLPK